MKTKIAVGKDARYLIFWCPGCDEPHSPKIEGAAPWTWNGDRDAPTLSPSILVTDAGSSRCHSYVTDGRIKFLEDSTHSLSGRTVEIPDWPYAEGAFGGVEPDA